MIFNTNPNQRIVTVKVNIDEPYGMISRKAEQIAVRKLDNGSAAYILYIHLSLNANGYQFAFSPAAVERTLGISRLRCRNAFNELVKKGFLKPESPDSNKYIFYQLPPEYKDETTVNVSEYGYIDTNEDISSMKDISYTATNASYRPTDSKDSKIAIGILDKLTPTTNNDIVVKRDTVLSPTDKAYPSEHTDTILINQERNNTNTKNNNNNTFQTCNLDFTAFESNDDLPF